MFMEIMQAIGYTVRDTSLTITGIILRVFDDLMGCGAAVR